MRERSSGQYLNEPDAPKRATNIAKRLRKLGVWDKLENVWYKPGEENASPTDFRIRQLGLQKFIAVQSRESPSIRPFYSWSIMFRYGPGGGLKDHVDELTYPSVASISLGQSCFFELSKNPLDPRYTEYPTRIPLILHPGDLLILRDEAINRWYHGIPFGKIKSHKKEDIVNFVESGVRSRLTSQLSLVPYI